MSMKPRSAILRRLLPLISAVLLGCAVASAAAPEPAAAPKPAAPAAPVAPVKTPAVTNAVEIIPQSVFLTSSPTQTLRDPFFPDSARRPTATPVATTRTNLPATTAVDLKLKAIFGTTQRPLATINSTTFGLGEEHDLTTTAGRIKVRCLEIRLEDETVIVEAAGTRRELRFPPKRK